VSKSVKTIAVGHGAVSMTSNGFALSSYWTCSYIIPRVTSSTEIRRLKSGVARKPACAFRPVARRRHLFCDFGIRDRAKPDAEAAGMRMKAPQEHRVGVVSSRVSPAAAGMVLARVYPAHCVAIHSIRGLQPFAYQRHGHASWRLPLFLPAHHQESGIAFRWSSCWPQQSSGWRHITKTTSAGLTARSSVRCYGLARARMQSTLFIYQRSFFVHESRSRLTGTHSKGGVIPTLIFSWLRLCSLSSWSGQISGSLKATVQDRQASDPPHRKPYQ